MMVLRYLRDLALWLLAVIIGPLAYWLFPRDMHAKVGRGHGKFRWRWADRIWGNEMDGLTGDAGYLRDHAGAWFRKSWPSFWWTCIRNPANNLARHIGPSGIVTKIERRGHLTVFNVLQDGRIRRGFFFFTPDWPLMFKVGYKLWPSYKVGDKFDGAIAFSIQRGTA